MNNFKLVLLTHKFFPDVGGTETNAEFLAEAMHSVGVEVTVITWTKETGNKLFPYRVIRNPGFFELLKHHFKADLVFENHLCLRLSWPLFITRKPGVIALNTWIKPSGTKNVTGQLREWWLGRAKAVIAVSNAVRQKVWPGAVVIENAYNDRLFVRDEAIHKTKAFIYLGRLVSDKGVDLIIEALHKIYQQQKVLDGEYTITIIGDGPEKSRLVEMVNAYGLENRVEFKGVVTGSELVYILNEHKYIIVPSTWEEPYGIVALEGMACGCIPIVSEGGGLTEAAGEAGVIFKRNDLDDLVRQMKYIVEDTSLEKSLKKATCIKLKKNTRQVIADRYLSVFKEVLAR